MGIAQPIYESSKFLFNFLWILIIWNFFYSDYNYITVISFILSFAFFISNILWMVGR